MDDTLKALILGLVEGLTEFLPVSSTGHLILTGHLLGFNDARGQVFEVAIQLGAILAVVFTYRARIAAVLRGLPDRPEARRLTLSVALAFLPAAVLGLAFGKHIKRLLFHPVPVATAFVVGAVLILWAERRRPTVRITDAFEVGPADALKIGFAQALALWPGMSRSGATIIGALFLGLSRQAATEFSFFLAIPTLGAACVYDLYKHRDLFSTADLPMFAVGFGAAFVSAMLAVKGLLRFIGQHDFTVFAWYRIAFGATVLLTAYRGWVDWGQG